MSICRNGPLSHSPPPLSKALKTTKISSINNDSDHPDAGSEHCERTMCPYYSRQKNFLLNQFLRVENEIINQKCGKNSKLGMKQGGNGVGCPFVLTFFPQVSCAKHSGIWFIGFSCYIQWQTPTQ